VLHAQAADVREAVAARAHRDGRPQGGLHDGAVVFLVLPVTVLFAFFPGVIGLSLTIP
jgi:tight adherence protein C